MLLLGAYFCDEFMTNLQKEITNTNRHYLFPTTIIDLIRHFIKSESSILINKYLVIFVEIILKL